MRMRAIRAQAVVALVAGGSIVVAPAANASGHGTFTRITTPAHNIRYLYNARSGAINNLTVSGVASADVTAVNIDCIYNFNGVTAVAFAQSVPVTAGRSA